MADLDSDPRSGRPAARFAKRLAPGHRIEVVALAWALLPALVLPAMRERASLQLAFQPGNLPLAEPRATG
ncbi:hypothetical protein [Kitasatospora sp. NPDC058190]|uniref:hypothetical protein n=1 Tax=Kitasatospora sp. NPDC058190 TaxID=3346371 RepID=UPI0036DE9595